LPTIRDIFNQAYYLQELNLFLHDCNRFGIVRIYSKLFEQFIDIHRITRLQDIDYLLVKFADSTLTWRDKISELGCTYRLIRVDASILRIINSVNDNLL
jgi:hypothetical protein